MLCNRVDLSQPGEFSARLKCKKIIKILWRTLKWTDSKWTDIIKADMGTSANMVQITSDQIASYKVYYFLFFQESWSKVAMIWTFTER